MNVVIIAFMAYVCWDMGRGLNLFVFTLAVMFPEAYYPSTSYLAHAAGFLLGILCGFAVLPFVRVKEPESFEDTDDHSRVL